MTVEQTRNLRQKLIALALRHQKPGAGSSVAFLTRRTANVKWYDPGPILAPLPWAVVGAVATRHYMPERMTKDLDLIVVADSAGLVRQKLQAAGLKYMGELSVSRSQWLTPANEELDVLEGNESWWPVALSEAQNNRDLQGLPILPLPYLSLMKFKAGRLQDIADMGRMLGQASPKQLELVRVIFRQHAAPDELEDLESIIALGQLEIQ